ncbi:MAG: ferritin family protein [Planctomycetes bacterium]|jgi:rubrerythrin|nr:ferritin family protein [Planctomycetota bacterium]
MSITFNADEVFEMAEQIERNGAKFYREAAGKTSDRQVKELFQRLAGVEDNHLRTFQEMRKAVSDQEKGGTTFDPEGEASLYLQAMADDRGYEGMRSRTEKLTGKESSSELLDIAIGAEKNSILYYVGLKELVPARAGREKVEAIIREEVRHLAELRRYLGALGL